MQKTSGGNFTYLEKLEHGHWGQVHGPHHLGMNFGITTGSLENMAAILIHFLPFPLLSLFYPEARLFLIYKKKKYDVFPLALGRITLATELNSDIPDT